MRINIADWIYNKIRSAIAIVQDGDTATQTIASGKYVIWKGELCKAKAAIPSGTALSSSNLEAVSDGGLNELNSKIENYKILRTRQTFSLTTGDAVLHFPGSGTANLGLAEKDVTTLVPSGAVYIACIPGQASRANGIDCAFALMRDSSTGTVRILGTPNQTYTVNVDILYRYPAT